MLEHNARHCPSLPETSSVNWHARHAFRLIATQHWRALIRLTSIDLCRTLRTVVGNLPLDSLDCLDDVDRNRFFQTYPPRTSRKCLLCAELTKHCDDFAPWFFEDVSNALELLIEIESGSPERCPQCLASPALALFLATERVIATVCRKGGD